MTREQRLSQIEEELREVDENEHQYREIIRKMDYPDGSIIESLWNAVTRTFPGMRFGTRQRRVDGSRTLREGARSVGTRARRSGQVRPR